MSHYQQSNLNDLFSGMNYNTLAMVDKKGNTYTQKSSSDEINEANEFKNVVDNYLSSKEGKNLVSYLSGKGKEPAEIVKYGAGPLGKNTVAAVAKSDLETTILANYQDGKGFDCRTKDFAKLYQLNQKEAQEYVLSHEIVHTAGYTTERGTEQLLETYFTELAEKSTGKEKIKYTKLAQVAKIRKEEAKETVN